MDTRPHGCDGLRLYGSLTQAVACFRLTVSAHLGVCMITDTLPTFMLFVAYATTIYKDCFEVHDILCGPCPTKIASFVYLVGETPFECCLCVNSWHTHQDRTDLLMPVILGTKVMRWRRRPRKRSIAFTTGSSRPGTSCPVGGCPVSARNSALSCGRVDRQHEQHFRRPEADPCSGHVSLRSRERARCGGHRCVPASWHIAPCGF